MSEGQQSFKRSFNPKKISLIKKWETSREQKVKIVCDELSILNEEKQRHGLQFPDMKSDGN